MSGRVGFTCHIALNGVCDLLEWKRAVSQGSVWGNNADSSFYEPLLTRILFVRFLWYLHKDTNATDDLLAYCVAALLGNSGTELHLCFVRLLFCVNPVAGNGTERYGTVRFSTLFWSADLCPRAHEIDSRPLSRTSKGSNFLLRFNTILI